MGPQPAGRTPARPTAGALAALLQLEGGWLRSTSGLLRLSGSGTDDPWLAGPCPDQAGRFTGCPAICRGPTESRRMLDSKCSREQRVAGFVDFSQTGSPAALSEPLR